MKLKRREISLTLPFKNDMLIITKFENLFDLLRKLSELRHVLRLENPHITPPVLLEVQLHTHAGPAGTLSLVF